MINRHISDESHPHQATPVMHCPAVAPSWHERQAWLPEDFMPSGCRLAMARISTDSNSHTDGDIALPAALERAIRQRRAEFIAGRRCAREALLGLTGQSGFPSMGPDRAPLWPTQVVGSISHCREQAIAVAGPVDRYRGLGIDLEQPFSASQSEDLGPLVLARSESERWHAELHPFLVCLSFSAKESLFKALFPLVQRRFDFAGAELIEWDLQGHAVLRLRISLGGRMATRAPLSRSPLPLPGPPADADRHFRIDGFCSWERRMTSSPPASALPPRAHALTRTQKESR